MRCVEKECRVVKYVAERGSRKGQAGEYVELILEKRTTNWVANNVTRRFVYPIVVDRLVETFKKFISKKAGGEKDGETVIPEEYKNIDNYFLVQVDLGAPHVRLYRQDEKDAKGKVIHHKGHPHTDDSGKPILYNSVEVGAIKVEDDDTGEMYWVQTPESIVQSLISRGYYAPAKQTTSDEPLRNSAMSVEAAPETTTETAPEETPEERMARLQTELEALKANS